MVAAHILLLSKTLPTVVIISIVLHTSCIVVFVTFSDQMLLLLGVSHLPLLLAHGLLPLHILHPCAFTLLFFLADALALFFLSSTLSFLLLLSLGFRFLSCSGLLFLHCSFLRFSLSLSSGLGIIFAWCFTLILVFSTSS